MAQTPEVPVSLSFAGINGDDDAAGLTLPRCARALD
jgi:hypothetical protein